MPPVTYFVRMTAHPGRAEELLLSNYTHIRGGEPGNLAFAVHRATDDPDQFWLYETWESQQAVDAHESVEAFLVYKERLRPLVDGDTVLFGNATPVALLGYEVPAEAV